jgi:hypothetical protein
MATIKISNLNSAGNNVIRALDAWQLHDVKGGLEVAPIPVSYGFKIVNGKAVCVQMPFPST